MRKFKALFVYLWSCGILPMLLTVAVVTGVTGLPVSVSAKFVISVVAVLGFIVWRILNNL